MRVTLISFLVHTLGAIALLFGSAFAMGHRNNEGAIISAFVAVMFAWQGGCYFADWAAERRLLRK